MSHAGVVTPASISGGLCQRSSHCHESRSGAWESCAYRVQVPLALASVSAHGSGTFFRGDASSDRHVS